MLKRLLLLGFMAAALMLPGTGCGPTGPKGYIEIINDASSPDNIIEIAHGPNSAPTLKNKSVNIPPGGSYTISVDADVEWVVIVYWFGYSDLDTATVAEGVTYQMVFLNPF